MPFGVEMLHLLGMEVLDDWWWGGLVGPAPDRVLCPGGGGLIAGVAGRAGSPRAGWLAAIVYLSTPWIYRLAVIAYVEGPLCYYHAALVWAVVSRMERSDVRARVALGRDRPSGRRGDGLQVPGLDLRGDPVRAGGIGRFLATSLRSDPSWLMSWAGPS